MAHDVEAQFSTVVTPALGAGHPVDRVHRSSVPGGNPRFSPKISEVKATDQQRPAQAPLADAHEALDAAVAAAYGWSADISDDEVLRELLALNGGLETEQ